MAAYTVVIDEVSYQTNHRLADDQNVGVFHEAREGQVYYCARCTDCRTNINRDDCLDSQFGADSLLVYHSSYVA
jgi:hypothetical protein